MTIPDVERVLVQRTIWGKEYPNHALESKRRSAIIYLRMKSRCGWIIDRLVARVPRKC